MEIVLLVVMIPALISAFILTLKTIYHLSFIVMNEIGKSSSFHGSLIFILPGQTDDEVLHHRNALIPLLIGVIISWLIIAMIIVVISII